MKKVLFAIIGLVTITFSLVAQDNALKSIQVTATSKIEVTPDEYIFEIGLQDYWKEELEEGKTYKDYKTKISLDSIEKQLLVDLQKLGITQNIILPTQEIPLSVNTNKNYKKTKSIDLLLTDTIKIALLLNKLSTTGINYMRVTELRKKDLDTYLVQVKTKAMAVAQKEATLLALTSNNKIGNVISITEIDDKAESEMTDEEKFTQKTRPSSKKAVTSSKIILKYKVQVTYQLL